MDRNQLFSVRESLLGPGEPECRFYRSLVEAKRFIDATSVASLMDLVFKGKENRCSVMESVRDMLHVGFMISDENLTIAGMSRAAMEARFRWDHFTFESTLVARELGEFVGLPHVATTVFAAHAAEMNGRAGYVETFIPTEERNLVRRWMEEEVEIHIGLILASPSAFATVQNAFQTEGFRIPPFMKGRPIANYDKGVATIYYDKLQGNGKLQKRVSLTFHLPILLGNRLALGPSGVQRRFFRQKSDPNVQFDCRAQELMHYSGLRNPTR